MGKENENKEVWRVIKGFPRYKISNKGRVKSFTNPKKPKILRPSKNKGGYLYVHLSKGREWGANETECVRIHQLVARAFIPNPDNKCHIDHIDTDTSNNNVENLRWVTPEENSNNPITKQHRMEAIPKIIEQTSKPVLVYDEDLTLLSAFTSTAETARQLNLSQGNIVNVCSGSLKHYKHLIFSFTPLNSKEDRERQLQEGEEKHKRRLQQINKACQKLYWSDAEKYRERGRLYAARKKKHGKEEIQN